MAARPSTENMTSCASFVHLDRLGERRAVVGCRCVDARHGLGHGIVGGTPDAPLEPRGLQPVGALRLLAQPRRLYRVLQPHRDHRLAVHSVRVARALRHAVARRGPDASHVGAHLVEAPLLHVYLVEQVGVAAEPVLHAPLRSFFKRLHLRAHYPDEKTAERRHGAREDGDDERVRTALPK